MRECRGECHFFERVSFRFGGKIYQKQIKYCSICGIFMKISGYRCPCCRSNLEQSHMQESGEIECQN